jgi:hypothetical protein
VAFLTNRLVNNPNFFECLFVIFVIIKKRYTKTDLGLFFLVHPYFGASVTATLPMFGLGPHCSFKTCADEMQGRRFTFETEFGKELAVKLHRNFTTS